MDTVNHFLFPSKNNDVLETVCIVFYIHSRFEETFKYNKKRHSGHYFRIFFRLKIRLNVYRNNILYIYVLYFCVRIIIQYELVYHLLLYFFLLLGGVKPIRTNLNE